MQQAMENGSNQERTTLKKSMSPLAIWALAFGAIIGWGAFVMPGFRFLPVAGPLGACLGFAIGAVMFMFVAAAYGKLVGLYPVAGGVFAFAYGVFGSTAAFICGWALVLGYISFIALNATALVLLTRFLMPGVLEFGYMYTIEGWRVFAGELLFIEAVLFFFGYMNYRGASLAAFLQTILAFMLTFGVIGLVAGAAAAPTASSANLQPLFAEGKSAFACIAAIVAIAPWLFAGFDTIPQAAEEFNFSPTQAIRLMVASIACGAAVYCLVTLAVGMVIPYPELLAQNPPWHAGLTAKLSMGGLGTVVLACAVLGAILTGINGFFVAGTRLLFSMGRARILPRWFADLHPVHQTPRNSIMFAVLLVTIAPLFGREVLGWVVDMSSLGIVVAYFYACWAAYRVLGNSPEVADRGFYRVMAVLGCLSSVACFGLLVVPASPAAIGIQSWIALLVWVGLGVVLYFTRLGEVRGFSERERSFLILGDAELADALKAVAR